MNAKLGIAPIIYAHCFCGATL